MKTLTRRFFALAFLSLALLTSLAHAQVGSTLEEQVQKMYVTYYGRPGDPGGVAFWVDQLTDAGGDLSQIIDAFGTSAEYDERFGALSNEVLINNLYQQLFGRDADSGGLNFYLDGLISGDFTLAAIALNIADGVQDGSNDFSIVSNKLSVAISFTEQVATNDYVYDGTTIADVVSLLAGVGVDVASIDAAISAIGDTLEIVIGEPTGDGVRFRMTTEEGILSCSGSIPIPDIALPSTSIIVTLQFDGDRLIIPANDDFSVEGFTIVENSGSVGSYNESDGSFSVSQTIRGYSNDDPAQAVQDIFFTTEGVVSADSWFGTSAFAVSLSVSGFDIDCAGSQEFFGERLD